MAILVVRMYRENPSQFSAKMATALEAGRVTFRTMWKPEENKTYVWLQPI